MVCECWKAIKGSRMSFLPVEQQQQHVFLLKTKAPKGDESDGSVSGNEVLPSRGMPPPPSLKGGILGFSPLPLMLIHIETKRARRGSPPPQAASLPASRKAKPVCEYGAKCYRKNPQHFIEYDHPGTKPPAPAPAAAPPRKVEEEDVPSRQPSEHLYQSLKPISSGSLSPQKKPPSEPVSSPPKRGGSFDDTKNDLLDFLIPGSKGKEKEKEKEKEKDSISSQSWGAGTSAQGEKKAPSAQTRNLFVDEEPALKTAPSKVETISSEEDRSAYVPSDEPMCLSFSSFSTGLGHFDRKEAGEIVKASVTAFLASHPHKNLRLVMVIDPAEPETYSEMKRHPVDDPRFSIIMGDVSKLRTKCNIPDCGFIGIEATWRLQAGGSGARKVHDAAGKVLQEEAKRLYQVAKVGVAYPVKLPSDCPLTLTEGVHQVINVVGPNFNPDRPDYMEDKVKGAADLRRTYDELFKSFFKLTHLPPAKESGSVQPESSSAGGKSNANSGKDHEEPASTSGGGHWSAGLYPYIDHPEREGKAVFDFDKEVVTIYDKYPKVGPVPFFFLLTKLTNCVILGHQALFGPSSQTY